MIIVDIGRKERRVETQSRFYEYGERVNNKVDLIFGSIRAPIQSDVNTTVGAVRVLGNNLEITTMCSGSSCPRCNI